MSDFLVTIAIVVALNSVACIFRLVRGPTTQDRLLAVNMFDTKVLVVLLLTFFVLDRPALYLDVALLYALLNFVITVTLSRFLETQATLPVRPPGDSAVATESTPIAGATEVPTEAPGTPPPRALRRGDGVGGEDA